MKAAARDKGMSREDVILMAMKSRLSHDRVVYLTAIPYQEDNLNKSFNEFSKIHMTKFQKLFELLLKPANVQFSTISPEEYGKQAYTSCISGN